MNNNVIKVFSFLKYYPFILQTFAVNKKRMEIFINGNMWRWKDFRLQYDTSVYLKYNKKERHRLSTKNKPRVEVLSLFGS